MKLDKATKWFNCEFYPKNKIQRAIRYEDGILPRIKEEEIVLFTPWGPRYKSERGTKVTKNDHEVKTLIFLKDVLKKFYENMPGKKFRWLFLGADLYGTKINRLQEDDVKSYFFELKRWVIDLIGIADFQLWSEYDVEAESFRQETRKKLKYLISQSIYSRAVRTANGMGKGSDAEEYLVERLAEAMLIENKFRPIKVSCVNREKDVQVDWELPVLYILPDELKNPWMK